MHEAGEAERFSFMVTLVVFKYTDFYYQIKNRIFGLYTNLMSLSGPF